MVPSAPGCPRPGRPWRHGEHEEYGAAPARAAARRRRALRAAADELAADQGSVVTRSQLHGLGFTAEAIGANLVAGRWRAVGVHCVCVRTGSLSQLGRHWAAVLEAGPRAYVDGDSALVLAGCAATSPGRSG